MSTRISPEHMNGILAIVANYCQENHVIKPGNASKITLTMNCDDNDWVTGSGTDNAWPDIRFLKENAVDVWQREYGTEKSYGQMVWKLLASLPPSKCSMYHLARLSESDLLKYRFCGFKTLRRIKDWLEEHDLCLCMSLPEFEREFEQKAPSTESQA